MEQQPQVKIETFQFNDFSENTYILYAERGEAYIIDIGCRSKREWEQLKAFITEKELTVLALLNTHAHLDHIFGVEFARKEWGVPFCLHKDDENLVDQASEYARGWGVKMPTIEKPDQWIADQQTFALTGHQIQAIHTPGHSQGGVCFYLPELGVLFSGDTLFARSIGRTDLPGGDYQTLIQSIQGRLLTLPGDTIVLPGHGPRTTIQDEIALNPFLS